MAAKLKFQISSAFKMHGFSLRSDANCYLVEVLQPINEVEREDWLDRIIDIVQKQSLTTSMVQKEVCEAAVQECNQEQENNSDNILNIIDTFSTPRFTYMQERKKFIPNSTLGLPTPALFGTAAHKASVFLDRYTILHQRTLRHDLFTPPILGAVPDEGSQKFQLKPLEYLKGTTAAVRDIIVLGMLTQLKEGQWHLEDPTASVLLDLTNTSFHVGLFAESCFVLAEGWYEDGVFHVDALGFPPSEPAKTTRSYFGNINMFGGPSQVCVQSSARLQQALQDNSGAMMIFIADLWLDNAKVQEKLRQLFSGFSDCPPTAFILCGHFLSSPAGQGHLKALKEGFKALGELIAEFPALITGSKFIFIPGPEDAGHPTILPRPAIPHCLTGELRSKVPGAVFTSNPCRLTYCSREMVIMRHDIVTKMCRHCLRFPQDGDVPTHFAKTVVSQGHVCPLPLAVCPVYWSYDCGLRLYPLPDLLVCADRFQPFTRSASDCTIINPGSFPRTDFSFKVYYPATGEVQDSKIP